ncbi:MAG: hypothetical protein M3256_22650, partial [Actinomycetota bacterium]|nr:hypothetical protein [Actinomycetota bacterium]
MSEVAVQDLHVFVHSGVTDAAAMAADVADETYTQRGSTEHFVVFYAQSLGADGPTLADAVLATCEADYNRLQGWFGSIAIGGLPFQVYIKPGRNGASHANCAATALLCDSFNGTDADLERTLVVAEADEVFMGNQGKGWDCGASNGEALSRILAAEIYPAQLTPPGLGITFATATRWLDSERSDWVNNTEPTDRNFVSIGCGTLFINWLRFQLGYGLDQIVQAGGSTLAQNFQTVTGEADGWTGFKELLDWYFVAGTPSGLTDDNPFPLEDLAMLGDGAGARVASAHQTSMHQLDAFEVDANGALTVRWVTDEGAWSGPAALTGNGFAPPGAAVAAAHQTSMHQLD